MQGEIVMDYLIPILSTAISALLPFEDVTLRIACGLAIAQVVSKLSNYFDGRYLVRFIALFRRQYNHVTICRYDDLYKEIMDYLYYNHSSAVKSLCFVEDRSRDTATYVTDFYSSTLCEEYNGYKFYFEFLRDSKDGGKSEGVYGRFERGIMDMKLDTLKVSSLASVSVIKDFILTRHQKSSDCKELVIYKCARSGHEAKDFYYEWSKKSYLTNKSIRTTILSEDVRKSFLTDIEFFFNNEEYFMQHGIPYKRGYLLYGEPGTGKTSIIKSIAGKYKIPIFIVNCSQFVDTDKFIQSINDIQSNVSKQRHIVLFDDLDKSSVAVTKDCLLGLIDGVDECYGRLVFITANDKNSILDKFPALLRHGRIDMQIKFTYCTSEQIREIVKLFSPNYNDYELDPRILITPCHLIHLLQVMRDPEKTIELLNKEIELHQYS